MSGRDWQLRAVPGHLRARYLAEGLWDDESVGGFLHERAATLPATEVRLWSASRPWRGTVADLDARARGLAAGLAGLGIGPGDVVSYQLPNHVEAPATLWALAQLGAVTVPVVHFYGPKELGFVLRESGARAHVTAARWGHLDYLAALEDLLPACPDLEHVVVADADGVPAGWQHWDALADTPPIDGPLAVDPDAPAVIAYTSGTTADPKGVVHSHRTLLAEVRQLERIQEPGGRPMLIGAPMAHAIGMLGGLLSPLQRGLAVHVADGWDPDLVLDAMVEGDIAAGSGATFFLTSLLDHPRFGAEHLARMDLVGLGGAPVPVAVGDRARDLGVRVTRSYGSTELPSTTGSAPGDPHEQRCHTDGVPLPGVDLRLLDADGRAVDVGDPGEIVARGAELFLGYTDPHLTAAAVDDDGWYRTGDVGILDERGALTITDRLSDVIIRGGENVSAAEVEEVVARHPAVAEVAVVAAPDPRLGEHGCAFVRVRPDAEAPDLAALRAHLEAAGLARQKWPEEVRVVADLPRTPSGKVRKTDLRAALRDQG